jgi:cell shape-determining protein MreD
LLGHIQAPDSIQIACTMKWYFISGAVLLITALIEASLLPAALGTVLRPGLVLVVSAVWAALHGSDGFAWALSGGLMLDLMSSVPLGLTSLGLLIGNAVATILDRAPIPSRLFRTTTWVAIVTVVSHGIILIGLALSGKVVDVGYSTVTVILPLMLLNPVLAIPVYAIMNAIDLRIKRQHKSLA